MILHSCTAEYKTEIYTLESGSNSENRCVKKIYGVICGLKTSDNEFFSPGFMSQQNFVWFAQGEAKSRTVPASFHKYLYRNGVPFFLQCILYPHIILEGVGGAQPLCCHISPWMKFCRLLWGSFNLM